MSRFSRIHSSLLVSDPCDESDMINPDAGTLTQQEHLKNKDLSQAIRHRNWLVRWVIITVSIWLALVLGIIICCDLSDTVKVTLLTTTTVNILGLPLIILKGLFK